MAGQGATTGKLAEMLILQGWHVVYTCIPNTPHVGVVPIPTSSGASSQRYPDILACKGEITKLVEVEMRLTEDVTEDILTRFAESVTALSNPDLWQLWRMHVTKITNYVLPEQFIPQCDLVICTLIKPHTAQLVEKLNNSSIRVYNASGYIG